MRHHMLRITMPLLLSTLLLFGSQAQGTTVLRMTPAQLIDQADLIATGIVRDVQPVISGDGGFIYTYVTLEIEQPMKGASNERLLTLRLDGGSDGDRTIEVMGMPQFSTDHRYLLFLRDNGDVACPVLGWGQGLMRIEDSGASGRTFLVDDFGMNIRDVQAGQWIRSTGSAGLIEPTRSQPVAGLIRDAYGRPGQPLREATEKHTEALPVDSTLVLNHLRNLIKTRSSLPQFQKGKRVISADIKDIPDAPSGIAEAP